MQDAIQKVVAGNHLEQDEMVKVMDKIMTGVATPAQIACFITALRLKGETVDEITGFAKAGGYVMGICNGFQILTESNLLPGALLHNTSHKFICKNIFLKAINTNTVITKNFGELITAFELMNKFSIDLTEKLHGPIKFPFKGDYYCLVELTNFIDIKDFNNFIYSKFEKFNFNNTDLVIAKSEYENKNFWQIREDIELAA